MILFDVGLQLCPDTQVSFHPVHLLFISRMQGDREEAAGTFTIRTHGLYRDLYIPPSRAAGRTQLGWHRYLTPEHRVPASGLISHLQAGGQRPGSALWCILIEGSGNPNETAPSSLPWGAAQPPDDAEARRAVQLLLRFQLQRERKES